MAKIHKEMEEAHKGINPEEFHKMMEQLHHSQGVNDCHHNMDKQHELVNKIEQMDIKLAKIMQALNVE